MNQILIVNLHSALNLGDDAIMDVTLRELHRSLDAPQVTAAANDPASWRKYGDLEVIASLATWMGDALNGKWRRGLPIAIGYCLALGVAALLYRWLHRRLIFGTAEQRRLLGAYYKADLVLSCGGGNFYAHSAMSPALWYGLLAIAFPQLLGKRVVMLPQSVGPISGSMQRRLARLAFAQVESIMVRDAASRDFLAGQLGLRDRVDLLPDLAFALSEPTQNRATGRESTAVTRIGITCLDRGRQVAGFGTQTSYEQALIQFALHMQAERACEFVFFVQCRGPSPDQDDREVTERLHRAFREKGLHATLVDQIEDALTLQQAYAQMDCMVGTRMHTAILALGRAVPTTLIGYQPKSCSMMAQMGLSDHCFAIESVTAEALYGSVSRLLRDQGIRRMIAEQHRLLYKRLQSWPGQVGDDSRRRVRT